MTAQEQLGRLGLPSSLADLTSRRWDAVVVGAGHNGLTAAAYLARAGRSVLVLEGRDRRRGVHPRPAVPRPPLARKPLRVLRRPAAPPRGGRTRAPPARLPGPRWSTPTCGAPSRTAPPSRCGTIRIAVRPPSPPWHRVTSRAIGAYGALFARIRRRLREGERDTWVGAAPSGGELEELARRGPRGARGRVRGVHRGGRGALRARRAPAHGPARTGHHRHLRRAPRAGDGGRPPHARIGEARGQPRRMGVRRRRHGPRLVRAGRRRHRGRRGGRHGGAGGRHRPGRASAWRGARLSAPACVVSNADPKRTVGLCSEGVPDWLSRRVERWKTQSPVLKINCGLRLFRRSPPPPTTSRRTGPWSPSARHRRHPGGVRSQPRRRTGAGVVRAVLPHRLRPLGRPCRAATP